MNLQNLHNRLTELEEYSYYERKIIPYIRHLSAECYNKFIKEYVDIDIYQRIEPTDIISTIIWDTEPEKAKNNRIYKTDKKYKSDINRDLLEKYDIIKLYNFFRRIESVYRYKEDIDPIDREEVLYYCNKYSKFYKELYIEIGEYFQKNI